MQTDGYNGGCVIFCGLSCADQDPGRAPGGDANAARQAAINIIRARRLAATGNKSDGDSSPKKMKIKLSLTNASNVNKGKGVSVERKPEGKPQTKELACTEKQEKTRDRKKPQAKKPLAAKKRKANYIDERPAEALVERWAQCLLCPQSLDLPKLKLNHLCMQFT